MGDSKTRAGAAATRADVAALAQVSETIVSYVLNNHRYVAHEKRQRVLDAIRELNYQPNRIARALRGKTTNHIAFIADRISNEHFGSIIAQMDAYAYDRGYLISLCANRNTQQFVSQMISRCFDGIMISSISFSEEYIRAFVDAGIPVVLLNQREYDDLPPKVGRIDTGLYDGARSAVSYLQGLGRRNILYIDRFSTQRHFGTMLDLRYRGYCDQMQARDMMPRVITGYACEDEVIAAVRSQLKEADAIFARNDQLAMLGMHALRAEGRRVPEDVAVVGFDNSSLSRFTQPALTTVEIDRPQIAKAAMEMLHAMIQGERPRLVSVSTRLIVRDSAR